MSKALRAFQIMTLLAFACCPRAEPPDKDAVVVPDEEAAYSRLAADAAAGRPLVAHVVVALCDNVHQGIVPVTPSLGDGQNPRTNLYWGAAYGLKTYLQRAGWSIVARPEPPRPEILERLVLSREGHFQGQPVRFYVVADAWDGKDIRSAIDAFLTFAAGRQTEPLRPEELEIDAGGAAHLLAFVGHNGLMDFSLGQAPAGLPNSPARSSVVLACASQPYFSPHLARGGSYPLLLTTGLMAPEAYTLDAVLTSWLSGERASAAHEAAAAAYHRYQKCGLKAARRLFRTPALQSER